MFGATTQKSRRSKSQTGLCGKSTTPRGAFLRTRFELMPGLRSALVHPYMIFYRINDNHVEIVRVLHERMEPSRHLGPVV